MLHEEAGIKKINLVRNISKKKNLCFNETEVLYFLEKLISLSRFFEKPVGC